MRSQLGRGLPNNKLYETETRLGSWRPHSVIQKSLRLSVTDFTAEANSRS